MVRYSRCCVRRMARVVPRIIHRKQARKLPFALYPQVDPVDSFLGITLRISRARGWRLSGYAVGMSGGRVATVAVVAVALVSTR